MIEAHTHTRESLAAKLVPFGQEHLLRFWEEVDLTARHNLATQIAALDLEQIQRLYRQGAGTHDWSAAARRAEPAPAMRLGERGCSNRWSSADARARGTEALRAGKIGVLLVA